MSWRPYFRNRLIDERPEGFCVIVPDDAEPSLPLACPVCSYLLRSREDDVAYRELQCCDWCCRTWAAARKQQWLAGWRPSSQEIAEAEASRTPLAVALKID